jgi:hypothetical protein
MQLLEGIPLFVLGIWGLATAALALGLWLRLQRMRRQAYIRTAPLPRGLYAQVQLRHPQLTSGDCQLVARGLRQYFLACSAANKAMVAMPSQVADDLWHAFILDTRAYAEFCTRAFGRFLHHTPAVNLGADRVRNAGLRRCWAHTCKEENIDPRQPARLPLLFALDTKLKIAGGFVYAADCSGLRRQDGGSGVHCGGDFSSSSVDGGTDGLSDGGDGGGDGGGCGGGD